MHRALLVDDIVYAILQNVTSSATDIINFASTCSAVSPPALNILWRRQSNLGPLIMCLPQDTWEVRDDNVIHLSREPLPTEWDRVRMNASRIRHIFGNPSGTHSKLPPKPHRRILQRLFALLPPTSLFPNLVKLDFETVFDLAEFSSDFRLLRQFLSPGLETLAFSVPPDVPAHEVEQLVDAFPAEAPGLRQLVISADHGGSPCYIDLPLNKLKKLNLLAVIRNVSLTRHTIAEIGRLRSLQVLALTLYKGSGLLEDSRLTDMPLELCALDCLMLVADRMQLCTSFLLRVSTPKLSSIGIKYTKYAAPEEVGKLVLSVHSSCRSFALEEITIQSYNCTPHQDLYLHSELPSHLFRPLLKFRRLKTAKFIDMGKYCLDDAFIEDAAVAWSDIHELRFASKETVTSTVTFAAMLSLASRCRSLGNLHLTFDATQRPTLPHCMETEHAPDGNPNFWLKQTTLQKLHVGHSKVSEAALAPFVLAVVFPNLVDITSYQTPGVFDDLQWDQVARTHRQLVNLWEEDSGMPDSLPNFVVQSMLEDNLPSGS
ncbi:uncharacterized protein EDB91DRAFT_1225893 [Suillus paluster]|uniref:uncharacterized protein n=1 Tax=Suillus paluster TaxID=48578 RepID=UPI001B878789|nr:uncharacterized protein EDB91DRAFT_1225893 [Suillus paluster]KAG1733908.1 hypothetical protein EDB91DRAFT_1225893 [Suillus paluster]